MKNLKETGLRATKVLYVLFLLAGLLIGWFIWTINSPYTYNTYGYFVECHNGKTFDPTSKPIDKTNYSEPYSFNDLQLKSECEYGTAFYEGPASKLSKNYRVGYKEYPHVVGSALNQIKNTVIGIATYYFLLEVMRRTLLYIFVGKKFFGLGKKIGSNIV